MDSVYPGNGACELCGQVDPCNVCAGVPTALLKLAPKTHEWLKACRSEDSSDLKGIPYKNGDKEKTA